MKLQDPLHIALVGSGGDGIMSTANMILRTASKMGLYGMMTQSYGPQIRGGEAAAFVTLGSKPVTMVGFEKDIVVCFRFSDVMRFNKELVAAPHAAVFHGTELSEMPSLLQSPQGVAVPIDFQQLLEQESLPEIAKNVVVFGILLRALGWDTSYGEDCVREVFGHKSSAIISSNLKGFTAGYRYLDKMQLPFSGPKPQGKTKRRVVSGNEACAEAGIAAGCRFFAGYPITPSSEILETAAELMPKVGGKLIQAEDEIASIGMIIGASFGGVPSMTSTSGPGLSLMTEMLGLSSMAEIPIVIVNCQRGGPATGLPSRTEQSDLWHAVYGGHGDFPRVVLAPTDVADCYQTLFRAFYTAEKYQMPAIVLSDATIAQRSEIIEEPNTAAFPHIDRLVAQAQEGANSFARFDLSKRGSSEWSGVTPMGIPGSCGLMHSIAGIEHTDKGGPSADGEQHEKMNQKRFRKLAALAKETENWFNVYGPANATHAVISWGSNIGALQHYIDSRNDTALFVPHIINPFPVDGLHTFLANKQRVTVLEMNFQGQLFQYLNGLKALPQHALSARRSGGLNFKLDELESLLKPGGNV